MLLARRFTMFQDPGLLIYKNILYRLLTNKSPPYLSCRLKKIYITEISSLLSSIAGLLVLHEVEGGTALDSMAAISTMDPKLGAQMLLAILFYNNIFIRKDISRFTMLPKLLAMLPALVSQSMMIPLVVQTILPMLQKDAKPTRRRLFKEKRVAGSKIEKMLDVFPRVIFSSGKKNVMRGTYLVQPCYVFPLDVNTQGLSRGLRDIHGGFENALVELASSLQLSRNIFVALISLESWKSFMRRWLRADVLSFDAKVSPIVLDKITKAASDILKVHSIELNRCALFSFFAFSFSIFSCDLTLIQ